MIALQEEQRPSVVLRKFFIQTLLIFLVLGCSTAKEPLRSLRVSFNMHPNTLDPARAGDFVSSSLICLIYEGLTRCHPEGGVELALAERVEISEDKKSYLFHLRKALWSDGQPITAYDFERGWKKAITPPSLSSAYLFYPLKNGEKCAKGEVSVEELGVKAIDAHTLHVELENPTPYFYSLTAFPSFFPAPSHTADPTVSSGPFRLHKMIPQAEIRLVKNERYWRPEAIFFEQIEVSIIPDEMTALAMFEQGKLDWLGGPLSPLPPDALEQMEGRLVFLPSAASTFLTFNTQEGPFQNRHLRQAFALAINRTEIVEKVALLGQIPARRILPPSLLAGEPLLPSFDPVAASEHFQQALAELQIEAASLSSLTLYYKPTQIDKRLAQALQKQWQNLFGVCIQLRQLDFKSHSQRLQNRDYQFALASWIAQFDDPISLLERFKDQASLKNYSGWEDPEYRDLIEQTHYAANRQEILEAAEELLAEQMPLAPIYHWRSPALCSPRLAEIGTTPCGGILFERFKPCQHEHFFN